MQQRKARGTHVATIFYILGTALSLYVYVLLARVILDLVQVFSREWKPTGFLLVLAEAVYTLTDPPLKMLRKVIPPLRLGQISLDLGFIVLLIGAQIIASVSSYLSYSVVLELGARFEITGPAWHHRHADTQHEVPARDRLRCQGRRRRLRRSGRHSRRNVCAARQTMIHSTE